MCALVSVNRKIRGKWWLRSPPWCLSLLSGFVVLVLGASAIRDVFLCCDPVITEMSHLETLTSMLDKNLTAAPDEAEVVETQSHTSIIVGREQVRVPVRPPDASEWQATPETPYQVCFVTSVYSSSPELSDRPPDIRAIRDANPTFAFFAFTCMDALDAPGWTLKKKTFAYKRYITQSRWAKFMGWKDDDVRGCQAVFYMDGFCGPKLKHAERYKRLANSIHESEFGLFQNQHEIATGPLHELDRIVQRNKDIPKNVEASKAWLLAQPDFRPDIPMYANHYMGYDPKNIKFQKAAQFFWDRYSLEIDSWRDQPLWSYVLDHFQIKPIRLGTFEALFKEHYKRMGHAGHRYDAGADSNALQHQGGK